MSRSYAGILGLIAYVTVLFRSVIQGGGVEGTVKVACLSLVIFGVLGFIAGWIAENTVTESVQAEIKAKLAELKATKEEEAKKRSATSQGVST